jgi:hypothetical protein
MRQGRLATGMTVTAAAQEMNDHAAVRAARAGILPDITVATGGCHQGDDDHRA